MWILDLCIAINELHREYGSTCCVEMIKDNVITMTNGDRWKIDSYGHITKI